MGLDMEREISNQKDLGSFIHDARTKLGITQEVLAERAGVSRKWLIGLEQGVRTRAELGKVFDTLEALGISLNLSFSNANQTEPKSKEYSQRLGELSPATLDAIKKASVGSRSALQKLSSEGLGQSVFQKLASEAMGESAIQRLMKEHSGQTSAQRAIGVGLPHLSSSELSPDSGADVQDEHEAIQVIEDQSKHYEHDGHDGHDDRDIE